MSSLKKKYQRFLQWQQEPFDYHDGHDHHECCNCGNVFDNNYCPRCGQKAVYGPVTWHSVWKGILDMWGVGSRSLPYSLWQLIWRPGYLIRDYISGKRQASFPPVKMMLLLGIVGVLISNWLDPDDVVAPAAVTSTGLRYVVDTVSNWISIHMEWFMMIACGQLIVPVWALFRESPKCRHHSLPQGFFIQVFTAAQFILVMQFIVVPIALLMNWYNEEIMTFIVFFLVVPLMLIIDYKQLFGYGWWGTLWRALLTVPMGLLIFKICMHLGRAMLSLFDVGLERHFWLNILMVIDGVVLLWLFIEVIGVINRKKWRDHGWWHVLRRPAIAALALFMTTWACRNCGLDGSLLDLFQAYENVTMI